MLGWGRSNLRYRWSCWPVMQNTYSLAVVCTSDDEPMWASCLFVYLGPCKCGSVWRVHFPVEICGPRWESSVVSLHKRLWGHWRRWSLSCYRNTHFDMWNHFLVLMPPLKLFISRKKHRSCISLLPFVDVLQLWASVDTTSTEMCSWWEKVP